MEGVCTRDRSPGDHANVAPVLLVIWWLEKPGVQWQVGTTGLDKRALRDCR